MDYKQFIAGAVLLLVFAWLLVRNSRRSGFMNALLRVDTILGLSAGIYLIITALGK